MLLLLQLPRRVPSRGRQIPNNQGIRRELLPRRNNHFFRHSSYRRCRKRIMLLLIKGQHHRKSISFHSPWITRDLESNRVTEIQSLRDILSVIRPGVLTNSTAQLPLNNEQRRVAEHPPNVPLSVRAGAGSGKTHCMVQRAVNLVHKNMVLHQKRF